MSKSRQPYAPEFRAKAICWARTSGRPRAEIARDLGMTSETLRVWLKQVDLDEGRCEDGPTTEEREELCPPSVRRPAMQCGCSAVS